MDNIRARHRSILAAGAACDPCSPVGPPDARIHEYIAQNNRAFCGLATLCRRAGEARESGGKLTCGEESLEHFVRLHQE